MSAPLTICMPYSINLEPQIKKLEGTGLREHLVLYINEAKKGAQGIEVDASSEDWTIRRLRIEYFAKFVNVVTPTKTKHLQKRTFKEQETKVTL